MSHQSSDIQSVVFERAYWTPEKARRWLNEHGFHPIKEVDLSHPKQYRYRLKDPRRFDHFISKDEPGHIMLVIGFYHPYKGGANFRYRGPRNVQSHGMKAKYRFSGFSGGCADCGNCPFVT